MTEIENLSCGIVIRDDRGVFLHEKHLFQADILKLRGVKSGERQRERFRSGWISMRATTP